jgi:hypothetical protein
VKSLSWDDFESLDDIPASAFAKRSGRFPKNAFSVRSDSVLGRFNALFQEKMPNEFVVGTLFNLVDTGSIAPAVIAVDEVRTN